jgi:hypothetical protein
MIYKELRELCIAKEQKDRAFNWFTPYFKEYENSTFDDLIEELKRHGAHYWSALQELTDRVMTTVSAHFEGELCEPGDYDRFDRMEAEWLQCIDAEVGTDLYKLAYDSDVEQYIKDRHECEEYDKQEQERYELREYVCHWAANDMDISLEEAYDTFDFLNR